MALLPIVIYPDPRLEQVSAEVPEINDEVRALVADMIETCYACDGVGLAAVQIGALVRIFVLDPTFAGGTKTDPALVFINPRIEATEGKIKEEEGCLSLPGVFIPVERFSRTRVSATNLAGERFEMEGTGLISRAFQHEIDHLDGKLTIEKIGGIRRKLALRKLRTPEEE
jgi:peptide deformylase